MRVTPLALCVATTVSFMCSNLARADEVERGRDLFKRVWKIEEGLGPLHNAKSCVACHDQGGTGGAGGRIADVDVLTMVNSRKSDFWSDAGFTSKRSVVLHRSSTESDYARRRFSLLGIESPGGAPCDELPRNSKAFRKMSSKEQKLRKRGHVVSLKRPGSQLELARRNTTALFGLALVDEISVQEIQRAAQATHRKHPQLSGRFTGRFGWRGQTMSLHEFVVEACENEIGITTKEARSPETIKALKLGEEMNVANDLTAFIAALPRPRRVLPNSQFNRNMIQNGEKTFETIGCSACHLPTLGGVTEFYSDLLVHDMGPDLVDSAVAPKRLPTGPVGTKHSEGLEPVPESARREWKTPALWGCADSAPYLHDGRASTLNEAILMHGGEAIISVVAYRRLDKASQQRLVGFLRTLKGPDREKLGRITGDFQGGQATMSFGHW